MSEATFNKSELAKFDGQNGQPAYVAVASFKRYKQCHSFS